MRFRPDPVKLDWAVAVLLAVGGQLEVWLGNGAHGERPVIAVSGTILAAAVAVRRRFPAAAGITAVVVANAVALAWRPPSLVTFGVAWMCAVYALTVWTDSRPFAVGVAVFALPTLVARAVGVGPSGGVEFTVIALVVMLLVRQGIRGRDRRAEMAERERELAAREAVVEERARIARELHDVIAHNVSMMVVQAGAERRVLDSPNGSTREVLQTIEQIGRGALTEMRRLVGMLRSDGENPLAPQPGLDDVATLVGQVREAGLPVELTVEGERRDLPAGIELSAYRIVQEALTNALKHAADAHAQVSIRYGADSLELEILDDGGLGGGATGRPGGGHGLVGMRERVALYGGRFDASRRPGGGFAALRSGASGFMLKDAPPEEIAAAVRIVASGEALLAPAVTRAVIEEFARREPPPAPAAPPALDELTPREREVLDLLARGLSNPEICERLVISEATAKTHVARILQKLDLRDRVQAVIYAYESGLVAPRGA